MTMRAIAIALCILPTTTCAPELQPRLRDGRLPFHAHVNLAGTFTLSPAGELSLVLAEPCTMSSVDAPSTHCDRTLLKAIQLVAETPWGQQVHGEWRNEKHLVFRVDWKLSGLDPLDADVPAMVAQPWTISGPTWTPSADETRQLLTLLDASSETAWTPSSDETHQLLTLLGAPTETEIVASGPPPSLEVTRFEIDGGALHAGSVTTLTVQITNRGPGTAYRVAATVRSGIMNLHGRRAEFGLIQPGIEKIRRLRLMLPASETSTDTMLVLVVDEGNGFAPPIASRRVPIAAPAIAPVLAVQCSIPGRGKDRPGLDAGEQIVMHCIVDNVGTGAASVVLETSVAGATPVASLAKRVASLHRTVFDLPISIPRELPIDSTVEIAVLAADRQFARSANTRIVGVIRKPRLCATGQLTHIEYRAKLSKLRAALAAGDLTQDQFDRYDVELVTCLNDAP